MSDIIDQLNAVTRTLDRTTIPAGEARSVVLTRSYDAAIEDVWDALTTGDRIGRWLLPVEGDLRLGGTYQLKDNARGEVLACEPPRRLRVTWVYGEHVNDKDVSEVEVRLDPDGDRTRLTLAHAAVVEDETWTRYGPGATGVGWDLGLVALDRHLHGQSFEPATWESSPDGKRAAAHSSAAWGAAAVAAGTPADQVTQWVDATTEFYTAD